jgi:hypothetical protein
VLRDAAPQKRASQAAKKISQMTTLEIPHMADAPGAVFSYNVELMANDP